MLGLGDRSLKESDPTLGLGDRALRESAPTLGLGDRSLKESDPTFGLGDRALIGTIRHMRRVEYEHLLPLVSKPSRYIDNEINAVHRDPAGYEVKVCLAFPDVYEVGSSHLGLKILYSIINRLDYAMADRTYLPWIDLIDLLRDQSIPLFALESRLPLKAFDLIGITLQSELTFSNVLELIDLAGIPVKASERNEDDPLIIAGGPCASNPLPLSLFIDAFLVGEGEEAIVEICRILHQHKTRSERLTMIAGLQGMYVPAIHDTKRHRILIRKYSRFHAMSDIHAPQLLSWQLATHNRHVSEIMRGCSRGCRFCHAGYFYRPVRERSMADIIRHIISETRQSGWDEAGLLSLSSSDYTCIKPLLQYLLAQVNSDKTHVALPSLRVDSLDDELVGLIGKLGREGLTIAPEAGSQRLRDIINKNLSESEIMQAVETALRLGWQKVKLYFMIGLPFETEADIDALIDLIDRINQISRKRLKLNITLSPFVPKPFTPFQWSPMLPKDQLLRRILRVKTHFQRNRNMRIRYHTIESSMLEAVISRGNEPCAAWIYQAWQAGARYDGWQECFDYHIWQKAAEETGLDIDRELGSRDLATPNETGFTDTAGPSVGALSFSAPAPPVGCISATGTQCWDVIDIGITQDFLRSEYRKAEQAVTTPDCRDVCHQCGVCQPDILPVIAPPLSPSGLPTLPANFSSTPASGVSQPYRYRITYTKTGLLRFVSHLDWMRMIYRLIAASHLDVVYTQGFSPHPRVSLGPPLANGVEGTNEFFDLELHSPAPGNQILDSFQRHGIKGFEPFACQRIQGKIPLPVAEEIHLPIPPDRVKQVRDQIARFQAVSSIPFIRHKANGDKTYDLKQVVHACSLVSDKGAEGKRSCVYQGAEGKHSNDAQFSLIKSLQSPALYDVLHVILDLSREELYRLPVTRRRLLNSLPAR
ncbi:MAG: TIGR03960 family B12-binding radical SAM protein [Candidatus Cloacimonetes bacterium]|nr:TIGR03960 family B12-binding radical SAM protein [Candidatus Cloacimonadota bacterium]